MCGLWRAPLSAAAPAASRALQGSHSKVSAGPCVSQNYLRSLSLLFPCYTRPYLPHPGGVPGREDDCAPRPPRPPRPRPCARWPPRLPSRIRALLWAQDPLPPRAPSGPEHPERSPAMQRGPGRGRPQAERLSPSSGHQQPARPPDPGCYCHFAEGNRGPQRKGLDHGCTDSVVCPFIWGAAVEQVLGSYSVPTRVWALETQGCRQHFRCHFFFPPFSSAFPGLSHSAALCWRVVPSL